MDQELVKLMQQDTPPLNPRLANGFATEQLRYAEQYIDDVFRSAARGFPEGFQYLGWERCWPEEEWNQAIRKRNTRTGTKKQARRSYETSPTDVHLVKYRTRLNGEDLPPIYMYLPNARQAGRLRISGSTFIVSPTLADRVISIDEKDIFVRFLRDRITFKRLSPSYSFLVDGQLEKVEIVYSLVHKGGNTQNSKRTVKAKTTMGHYLFARYGFDETFRKYAQCDVVVGDNLTYEQFPIEEWMICKTSASPLNKPKGYSKIGDSRVWIQPTVNIAIRRKDWTVMSKALIGAFFYVVDHLPELMTSQTYMLRDRWIILLGHILFSGNIHHGVLKEKIINHLESLDEYVDMITKRKLQEISTDTENFPGMSANVENFYDLAALIVERFTDWLSAGADKINSMYGKELAVNYYVLFDIISGIFHFAFAIKAASKKENGLQRKSVENLIMKHLKPGYVFKLRSGHEEISPHSYSGDNMAFKITSTLQAQSSSARQGGRKKGDRGGIDDATKKMHVSVAEFGAYSGMRKSDPSGRSQINLHGMIDHKGGLVRNPDLVELLDTTQAMLKV